MQHCTTQLQQHQCTAIQFTAIHVSCSKQQISPTPSYLSHCWTHLHSNKQSHILTPIHTYMCLSGVQWPSEAVRVRAPITIALVGHKIKRQVTWVCVCMCVCVFVCFCAQKIEKHDFILICVLRMRAHTCWYLFENSCYRIFLVCKRESCHIHMYLQTHIFMYMHASNMLVLALKVLKNLKYFVVLVQHCENLKVTELLWLTFFFSLFLKISLIYNILYIFWSFFSLYEIVL